MVFEDLTPEERDQLSDKLLEYLKWMEWLCVIDPKEYEAQITGIHKYEG